MLLKQDYFLNLMTHDFAELEVLFKDMRRQDMRIARSSSGMSLMNRLKSVLKPSVSFDP